MSHLVETMFSVREVPWHGLGKVVKEAPTAGEAIKLSGLDWEVSQQELFVGDNLNKAEKYLANVRSDNGRLLGIVSERYRVIQNSDAFAFTDKLLGGGVRYETAGSLMKGEKIWLLARAPAKNILGDRIEPYLCFTNTHNGKEAVRVLLTPIRVVCKNTLNLALKYERRSWSTRHTGSIEDKVETARATLKLADNYMNALQEEARRMVNENLSDKNAFELVQEVLPLPQHSQTEKIRRNVAELRKELMYRYTHAPDLQKFRGTAWGFIGAVSDFVSHSPPRRKTKTYRENNFAKLVSGHRILDRAYKLIA